MSISSNKMKMIFASTINGSLDLKLWNVPEDLSFFRKITLNHICIVGRLTFESLPYCNKRKFIVISGKSEINNKFSNDIIYIASTFQNCLNYIDTNYSNIQIYIIGGLQIYKLFEYICDEIIQSEIQIYSNDQNKLNYKIPVYYKCVSNVYHQYWRIPTIIKYYKNEM